MLSKEQAALAMGMKVREVVDVAEHPEGWVVTTHDGQRTLLEPVTEAPVDAPPVTPPPRMAARPAPAEAASEGPAVVVSGKAAPVAEKPLKRQRGGSKKPAEQTEQEKAAAEKAAADAAELAVLLDDAAGGEAAILAWVGEDKQRAHLAHTAESDRQHPRVDLLIQLEQLADAS